MLYYDLNPSLLSRIDRPHVKVQVAARYSDESEYSSAREYQHIIAIRIVKYFAILSLVDEFKYVRN